MKINIKPTVDCVFKALLGSKKHKKILINFLNAFLGLKKGKLIKNVVIMNPYNEREFSTDKLSIVDLKATDEKGRFYQIDVQISIPAGLAERMIFNWSQIYSTQLARGNDYPSLKPTTSIWILENPLFVPKKESDNEKYLHLNFKLFDKKVKLNLTDHLNINVIQLPYFKTEADIKDDKDRWLYFFKEGHNLDPDNLPEALQTEEMFTAMKTLKHFSDDQKAYLLYQERLNAVRLELTWQNEIKRARVDLQEAQAKLKEKEAQIQHLKSLLNQPV